MSRIEQEPIVSPLVFDGSGPVADAAAALSDELASQSHPTRWAVVRSHRRHEIVWFAFRAADLRVALSGPAGGVRLQDALALAARIPTATIQLRDLSFVDRSKARILIVLEGRRLFGLVELRRDPSERRSTGEARSIDAAALAAPAAPVREDVIDASAFVTAPAAVAEGARFKVVIGLSNEPPDGALGNVRLEFTSDRQTLRLDVEVVAPYFTSDDGWKHSLDVPRADPFTPRVSLWLRAPELPDGITSHATSITVYYTRDGVHCGVGVRRILVRKAAAASIDPPPPEPAAAIVVAVDPAPPDLTVRIAWRDDSDAARTLDWSFATPHSASVVLPGGSVPKTLTSGAAEFARRLLAEVTSADLGPGIRLLMEGNGAQIRDAMPIEFWSVLAGVADAVKAKRGADAVPTLLLLSQESQIPWELALLPKPFDPNRPRFLSTQCVVGRWLLDPNVSPVPPRHLTVKNMAVIVGEYEAGGNWGRLEHAEKESEALCVKHSATSVTATLENVIEVLERVQPKTRPVGAGADAVHFACHGEAGRADAAASSIILNNGSTIVPSYFRMAPVAAENRPLVFLNACQVGAAAPSLGLYGGFAGMCVRAGCSAVVAPLWSVHDAVAGKIALAFYEAVFAAQPGQPRKSAAKAIFDLRQDFLRTITVQLTQPDGTLVDEQRVTATPLAYVVYGHPGLILDRSPT